ncbi:hypothetical protein ABZP36_015477 [Zizania latifolia]
MEKGKEVLESSTQHKRPKMTRGTEKGGSQGVPADSTREKEKEVLAQSAREVVMECSQGELAESAREEKNTSSASAMTIS